MPQAEHSVWLHCPQLKVSCIQWCQDVQMPFSSSDVCNSLCPSPKSTSIGLTIAVPANLWQGRVLERFDTWAGKSFGFKLVSRHGSWLSFTCWVLWTLRLMRCLVRRSMSKQHRSSKDKRTWKPCENRDAYGDDDGPWVIQFAWSGCSFNVRFVRSTSKFWLREFLAMGFYHIHVLAFWGFCVRDDAEGEEVMKGFGEVLERSSWWGRICRSTGLKNRCAFRALQKVGNNHGQIQGRTSRWDHGSFKWNRYGTPLLHSGKWRIPAEWPWTFQWPMDPCYNLGESKPSCFKDNGFCWMHALDSSERFSSWYGRSNRPRRTARGFRKRHGWWHGGWTFTCNNSCYASGSGWNGGISERWTASTHSKWRVVGFQHSSKLGAWMFGKGARWCQSRNRWHVPQ